MKLDYLRIYKTYGKSGYQVTAAFEHAQGRVELECPPQLANKIIDVCMEDIIAKVREAANVTMDSLVRGPDDAAKEIEHKPASEDGIPF